MEESTHKTLREIVLNGNRDAGSTAILGVNGEVISYGRLRDQIASLAGALSSLGLKRSQRVALAMPNGAQMAVALLSVMACFTCAPVNPSLREAELERRLAEMEVGCMLTETGTKEFVDPIARKIGIESIQLEVDERGGLNVGGGEGTPGLDAAWAGQDDVIMLLQTSGTTGKPKLVGLTNRNIVHSVKAIKDSLALTARDRCLNMMPLFHVHGQTMLFASLAAGGSVVCTPGYDHGRFLAWLSGLEPTWFSAVPTILRAVCDVAGPERAKSRGRVRLIRSASSALPTQLGRELEDIFQVPVIEAYGMTEASHGIASNPLPPALRKAGSVGLPLGGTEVKAVGESGESLGEGEEGEIIIRGPSVIGEYLSAPRANARSFVGGWLRTGDLGYRDRDGYIFLTGRIKDIINRGGEKVAPREVEEALLANEAVSQAIVFPAPHPTLGEDVVAAVVLKRGSPAGEGELRSGLSRALAQHKVPSRIFLVDEIPKSPTGKPDRKGMWGKLKASPAEGEATREPCETDTERKVMEIWREVLRRDRIEAGERFLEAGGDSLRVTQVAARLREAFGVEIGIASLFEADTVAEQAKLVWAWLGREGGRQGTGR